MIISNVYVREQILPLAKAPVFSNYSRKRMVIKC